MTNAREIELSELMPQEGRSSVNPADYPGELFELLSIPAYDRRSAEIALGREIGSTKQAVQPGDVLLSKIVPHIRRAWVVEPSAGSRQIASSEWIVFRSKKADARYLRHFLVSDGFHRQFMQTVSGVGGSLLRARPKYVAKIKIPLPPLEEQRRIAAILDKAESINSLLKARQAAADLLMQSFFIDLFGNPKEEPSNSLFSIATLGERCVLFSGGTLPDGEENTGQEGGFMLLKVSDMNLPGNEERIKTSKLWASSPGAKSATCPAGSVVIPKRGGAIGTNKKRVVDRDAVLDPNLMAIAPGDQTITTEFLRGWFSFLDLSSITSGSSVPQLNKQDLSPLRLAVPPLKAQERYKELAIRALSMSDRLQKQSDRSHALLGALQRKYFSENNYE
jgi:type I restriction enzyme S subunit